jgi:hypothetical protein
VAEKHFWAFLRERMGKMGHLVRIENGVALGTPDVNGCIDGMEFWWELKEMPRWGRPDEPFHIEHYTREQRLWLRARGLAGGRAYLFLRIVTPRTLLLFDWRYAYHYVGEVPQAELESNAILRQTGEFDPHEIIDVMRLHV